MATPYLIEKWRRAFRLHDVNKDNVLTVDDAYCFADQAIKGGKLIGESADQFRRQYVDIFRKFFLETDKETEDTLITRVKKEYNENKTKFEEKVKEIIRIYVSITDLNGDGKISQDEYMAQLREMGVYSFGEKYFNLYQLDDDRTIPVNDFFTSLVEFYCNNDKDNVSHLEKAASYGFGMEQI